MSIKLKALLVFGTFLLISGICQATDYYWVAGVNANWNSTLNNWRTGSSGGPVAVAFPGSADKVFFTNAGLANCTLNVAINVGGLQTSAGYTGTLVQSNTVAIGSQNVSFAAGTFSGSATNTHTLSVTGTFSQSGGSFTCGAASTSISGAFTFSGGTFTCGSGTTTMSGAFTQSGGTFNTGTGAMNFNSTVTINTAGGAVSAFNCGSTAIKITGFSQSGGTFTASSGTTTMAGGFSLTGGTFNHNSGTVLFSGGGTVAGTASSGVTTFYRLTFSSNGALATTYSISSGCTLKVTSTFSISGTAAVTINTGAGTPAGCIHSYNNISIGNTGLGGGGSAILQIMDDVSTPNPQLLAGNGTLGGGALPIVLINKGSGNTLRLSGTYVSVGNNWTFSSGALDAATNLSNIVFTKTCTINNGAQSFYHMTFSPTVDPSTYNVATGTTITVTKDFQISGNKNVTINGGSTDYIYLAGNIKTSANNNAKAGGTGTICLNGTGAQVIQGQSLPEIGVLPNIRIAQGVGGTVTLESNKVISVGNSWNYISGTVSSNDNTVAFYTTAPSTISTVNGANEMIFGNMTFAAGTKTLGTSVKANNNITINLGATFACGIYDVRIKGNWSNNGTFSQGTGYVIFNGDGTTQTVNTSATSQTFTNMEVNRSPGNVQLNKPLLVTGTLSLMQGVLVTTTTNLLTLNNGSSVTGASNASFVTGPMKKVGNTAFTFPLGGTVTSINYYHPLAITAPTLTSDAFTAEYLTSGYPNDSVMVDSLARISNCEYWNLTRDNGSSNVQAKIQWNSNSCDVSDFDDLSLASWNGAQWIDNGGNITVIDASTGTIESLIPITFVNGTPKAVVIGKKVVPYACAVLKRKPDASYYIVKNGKLMFKFDEEYADTDSQLKLNIYNQAHQLVVSNATITQQPSSFYGDNRYNMNTLSCSFTSGGNLPGGRYYFMEVINEKGEKWYLRFYTQNTINVLCASVNNADPQ